MTVHKITVSWDELRAAHPAAPTSRLQRLGVEPGNRAGLNCDGIVGPKTRSALYLNASLMFEAQKFFGSLRCANLTPRQMADAFKGIYGPYVHPIAVAAFVDVWNEEGETHGNNRGPYISELYEDPNPVAQQGAWCGVAGRRWIRKAYPGALPNPRTAWMAKGLARAMSQVSDIKQIRSGDQLTSHRMVNGTYDNINGHAATCVAVDGDLVWTIEGNIWVLRQAGKPRVDGVAARMYKISTKLVSATGAPLFRVSRWPE